jgi:PAS domain S-box-containing protein
MDTALETRNRSRHDAHAIGGTVELPLAVEAVLSARTAEAVFVVDPGNRIVHWDARAESLTGILAEEAIGKPCHEAISGECGDGSSFCSAGCPVMQVARAGGTSPGYDMRIFTRSSGRRWVNVSILAMDTDEGPYLVHLVRDAQETHETLEMARGLIRLNSGGSVPAKKAPDPRDVPDLTPRQLEVLELLGDGKSVRDIGAGLYLSQATVRNHVRSLLQALGSHSQLEALAQARKLGILAG